MTGLILLKLGGSLITDKTKPYTPRLDKLAGLAAEIARAIRADPGLQLVLGHGSGSFGHTAAKKHGTRDGLTPLRLPPFSKEMGGETEGDYWSGFAEVWFQASALNRFVMQALHEAGIASVAFAPVAAVVARDGQVLSWNLVALKAALGAGLLPVVYGDVIFDTVRGGTILSTEDLFAYLAEHLRPARILLAGLERGVWADYPVRTQRVERITPDTFSEISDGVGKAAGADVTGGMESKVVQMLRLVQEIPGLTAEIFSAEESGTLGKVLSGEQLGTVISA